MDRLTRRMQRFRATRENPNPAASSRRPILVNPLTAVVRLFVNTFGITQPTPETEKQAGRIISLMLGGVLVLLGAVAWLLRAVLTR
jgi:hypothetical protein